MAHIAFDKLSEHTAEISGMKVVLWRIRVVGSIDEYYVRADKAHNTLGGGYWCDSRYLIDTNKVSVPTAFQTPSIAQGSGSYQQIICGQCNQVNMINIDTLYQNQGSHFCKRCNSTVAIVINNRINLRHGSKAGNIISR